MPELVVERVQRPQVTEPGVVHEHVQTAEAIGDLRERRGDAVAVADVDVEGVPVDLVGDRTAGAGVTIDDRDDRTLVRERDRSRLPDPRTAAGDDGDLSDELGHERSR